MANPMFFTFTQAGDIYVSLDPNFQPAGTVVAVHRLNSSLSTQKIGTLSGSAGAYSMSGGTGPHGKEKV